MLREQRNCIRCVKKKNAAVRLNFDVRRSVKSERYSGSGVAVLLFFARRRIEPGHFLIQVIIVFFFSFITCGFFKNMRISCIPVEG